LKGRPLFLKVGRETIRAPIINSSLAASRNLPPADVPEHRLFALLQKHRRAIVNYLDASYEGNRLDGILQSILRTTLRTPTFEYSGWRREGPGRYLATKSDLRVDIQTAEIMWRRDELKPIPDSMSQFVDFEALFSKEALHCGLVSRQSHRHWVHVVGTSFDLIEWDEYEPLDQGIACPTIVVPPAPVAPVPPQRQETALILAALGFDMPLCIRALEATKDNAEVAAQRLLAGDTFEPSQQSRQQSTPNSRPMFGGARRPDPAAEEDGDGDSNDEEGEQSIFQMLGRRFATPNSRAGPPKSKGPKSVDNAQFDGSLYNRHFDPYNETPHFGLIHESEFWVADVLGPVLLSIYPEEPEEKKMKYKLLLPETPLAQEAAFARLIGMIDPGKDHATWKEVIVWKQRRVVHVYNFVSHGRRIYRSLVYTSDSRYCLHSLTPNTNDRSGSVAACVASEAGDFKRKVVNEPSLVITRRNMAIQGHETYLPARLLQGVLPSALLEAFRFVKKV
jgi:hypothetical protein